MKNANLKNVNFYSDYKEALEAITKGDKDYIFIKHEMHAGDFVKEHHHPKAEEWMIFDQGEFEVVIDSEKTIIGGESLDQICAVHFPKKSVHGVRLLKDSTYFVLRSCKDEIIYKTQKISRKDSLK